MNGKLIMSARNRIVLLAMIFGFCAHFSLYAGEVQVAVASNFSGTLEKLGRKFESSKRHKLIVSSGASGKLYTQIKHGAPFEVFLSADADRPRMLEAQGFAVKGSRFTYGIGKLVLWGAKTVSKPEDKLKSGDFKHLAIADPKTAPYGEAARETLTHLGLDSKTLGNLVTGESLAQTFQFVDSGAAELGFVALSQLRESGKIKTGSHWIVPDDLHQPIEQQAVLLISGEPNPTAHEFLEFLKSDEARKIIEDAGYDLTPKPSTE
ncbi:molybdate ABC transporter substrate-binding protein [Candidatus Sumerlaeota bacterium]|nr:molybdate ABC transporter substrate-binding protein [Candidatus Sumerlaeota bacterium]